MKLYTIRNDHQYHDSVYADVNRACQIRDRLNQSDSNPWRVETCELDCVGSVIWYPHLTTVSSDEITTYCGDVYSWIAELTTTDYLWTKILAIALKHPTHAKITKYDIWVGNLHLKIEMLRVVRDIREEVG